MFLIKIMNHKLQERILAFHNKLKTEDSISTSDITHLLDDIASGLNLVSIYTCEQSGISNNFLYTYCSSSVSNVSFFNLLVFTQEDIQKFVQIFHDGITVFNGEISASKRATAKGNLAYGYIENDQCIGFVSFQPKEEDSSREWTSEEKEIIKLLALALRPIFHKRQMYDRFAYQKCIDNSSIGLFWYYPKLKLIIVPEKTSNLFSIKNYIYKNAPESFSNDIADKENVSKINSIFYDYKDQNKTHSTNFPSKKGDVIYRLSLANNRYDDENEPIEIMGSLEKIDEQEKQFEEKTELLKRYERFKQTISDNNLVEYYVNLLTGKVTAFKVKNVFQSCFSHSDNFDEIIAYTAENFITQESYDSFKSTLNIAYLRDNLNNENQTITLTSNFIVDGKERRLETIVALNSTSIYNYSRDAVIFVRDITYSESLNYDKLTGLLTMSHFLKKVENAQSNMVMNLVKPQGEIIYYDFVQFKLFNFEYGIVAGDKCLKKFAAILKEEYKFAFIARFADDHFVVFDYGEDANKNVFSKIEKVLTDASQTEAFRFNIKAGVYHLKLDVQASIAVDCAQIALQAAKKSTTLKYKEYDDKLMFLNERRKYICNNIQEAVKNNWIKVYYQPVISNTFKLAAFEALARWDDPKYGFLSPADFIPVLEESNLLYILDSFIVEKLCEKMRYEIDNNRKVYPTSFNLSRTDFLSHRPKDIIESIRKKYDIPSSLIAIEITESVMIENKDLIKNAISEFRSLGYEVWMDDFGSGYSSLNVLKEFSFDEIKIDMGFLRSYDEKSKIILRSIINMAKQLSIRTLTEGVETKEHVDFLISAGCERMQGYFFSKPQPYDDVIAILKKINVEL